MSLARLEHCIRTHPVIDQHAHNVYSPEYLAKGNLLSITTEAADEALEFTCTSLPHLRAKRQLCRLYGILLDSDWETVIQKRLELVQTDADTMTQRCLENTDIILLDDLFDDKEVLQPYQWHSKFTRFPCKRLIRIEELASDILSSLHDQQKIPTGTSLDDEEACMTAWTTFLRNFESAILAALESPEVAGFKSAACFTVGLDIDVSTSFEAAQVRFLAFRNEFLPTCVEYDFAVETKGINDALVLSTCQLIEAAHDQGKSVKPLQFHTGIGNKEIPVIKSNPAHLQSLITAFPAVPIVLLHTSYPYTRTAGHLATVFVNVFLDLSAVFPEVSRDGQETNLRQCLEMAPWRKILWSTDGHWFPETFWLANVQFRDALLKVFGEYVEQVDLTQDEAIEAVKDILFENANDLYQLRLQSNYLPLALS